MKRNVIIGIALAVGVFWGIESNVEIPAAQDEPVEVVTESEEKLTAEEERYLEFMDHHMDELQEMSDEFDRLYDLPFEEAYDAFVYGTKEEERLDMYIQHIRFMGKLEKLSVPPAYRMEFDQTMEELERLNTIRLGLGSWSFEVEAGQETYYEDLPKAQEMYREIIARHRL